MVIFLLQQKTAGGVRYQVWLFNIQLQRYAKMIFILKARDEQDRSFLARLFQPRLRGGQGAYGENEHIGIVEIKLEDDIFEIIDDSEILQIFQFGFYKRHLSFCREKLRIVRGLQE